jgi:hypothetical protein
MRQTTCSHAQSERSNWTPSFGSFKRLHGLRIELEALLLLLLLLLPAAWLPACMWRSIMHETHHLVAQLQTPLWRQWFCFADLCIPVQCDTAISKL